MMADETETRLALRGSPIDGLVELVMKSPTPPRREIRLEVCRFVGDRHQWSEEIPKKSASWEHVGPDGLLWPTWRFLLRRLDRNELERRAISTVGKHPPEERSESVADAVSISWLTPKESPLPDPPVRHSHNRPEWFAALSLGPGPSRTRDARAFIRVSALTLHNRGWIWTQEGHPWMVCRPGEDG